MTDSTDFPELLESMDLPEIPDFHEPTTLPADFTMFCNIVAELMQESDLNMFPEFPTHDVLKAINPAIARLNDKGWKRVTHELAFWNIVARRADIFSAYSTCTFDNDLSGPFISVTKDGVNMNVSLSPDCTGIMVNIFQIFDGLVCGTTFIVDPMNEITVCNINDTPLHERIVVASVVDGDVLFTDMIHPTVTAIYNANRTALEAILLYTP